MYGSSQEASFDEVEALNRVPLSDALDALDGPRRRSVLFALLESEAVDGPRTVVGETEGVVLDRHARDTDHLSKLVEYGFVDRDDDGRRVRRGANFADLEPLLELLVEHEHELPRDWR